MILIIEGPDGAGKTTYARSFRNAVYHHEGPPPGDKNLVDYYLGQVERAAAETQVPHVFDRSAMSEVVYGPILRGGSRIDREGFAAFESGLRGLGAVLIVCLPPYDVCRSMWEKKLAAGKELLSDVEQFDKAYRHFEGLARTRIAYDWTVGR